MFESIKIVDGVPQHLDLHTARINRSRRILFGSEDIIDCENILAGYRIPRAGIYKCRFMYGRTPGDVEFIPYRQRHISSLVLVRDDAIRYDHKYTDRSSLERYSTGNENEEACIVQNGLITDTTYTNLVFTDGREWITPSTPLLRGIQREYLLSIGAIREAPLKPEDLGRFSEAILINAMMDLRSGCRVMVEDIRGE